MLCVTLPCGPFFPSVPCAALLCERSVCSPLLPARSAVARGVCGCWVRWRDARLLGCVGDTPVSVLVCHGRCDVVGDVRLLVMLLVMVHCACAWVPVA